MPSLNGSGRKAELQRIAEENQLLLKRIQAVRPQPGFGCETTTRPASSPLGFVSSDSLGALTPSQACLRAC
jgi:hypothetical protein